MSALLQIAVINAVTVVPFAVLALIVSRTARRPALTHALWVLVLLKFVTPPLFNLPVTIEMPTADVGHVSNVPVLANVPDSDVEPIEAPLTNTIVASRVETISATAPVAPVNAPVVRQQERSFFARTLKTCSTIWARRPDFRSTLLTGWLAGAALWLTWQLVRAVRFQRRVLRGATPDSELQGQTQQLAESLGLRCVPRVLIVDAAVSPMLWGCGSQAKLLFPSDLAERLAGDARATLLTHELAHFARGDHWVRLLELVATGLFWWHPIVWWAKHKIEEAEEECCDAWVVHQFPNTPRQYAEALLDTIDFLCESRQALPPVACGLGQAHFLRHRLTKIMRGAAPKAMSQRVRCALALVAALLLPLQPFVFGSASLSRSRIEAVPIVGDPRVEEKSEISGQQSDDDSASVTNTESSVNDQTSASPARRMKSGERTWSTAASADGRFVVRATTARRVLLTDRLTNQETDLSSHGITAVAFVPDRSSFVAVCGDGRVTLWDAVNGELTRELQANGDAWRSVSVSPRGDAVAVGGKEGSVLVLDLATGATQLELPRQAMAVNSVRFSPDGQSLAVAMGDWNSNERGRVVLFDVETQASGAVLECESAPGAITFASSGDLIVGLWNGQADLWNLESRRLVGSAQANKSVVAAASFSPDNPALREVDFVATRPVATEDQSDNPLLDFFFGGRRP